MSDDTPRLTLSRRELLRAIGAMMAAAGGGRLDSAAMGAATHAPSGRADADLVGLVNPMQGTDSTFGFSRGNTLPLVTRPFGMVNWSLQTGTRDGWFFQPAPAKIQGVRATHQPSPWMGDYGRFTVMAQAGAPALGPDERASAYQPDALQVHPDYLSILCERDGTRLEAAPSERGAVFRFTFPTGSEGRVIFDGLSRAEIIASERAITGFTRHKAGGAPDNFACYFYARFDRPFAKATPLQGSSPAEGQASLEGDSIGAVAEFDAGTAVILRIGTSFISTEQARQNLEREIGHRSLEAVRAEAARVWNETLGVVRVKGGTIAQRRTFYSCLYRAHLFPRMLHEPDAEGHPIHYSPYDGKVHPGVLYGDTGLWDGYHTVYPLLSLLQPARLGEMIQGFVNAYREGGWLPQWPSPGSRGGMGGTHSDVVIADAVCKNIPGFDRADAYAGMLKNATTPPGQFVWEGRHGLAEYLSRGYVPVGKSGAPVSNSLDYAYDDFCVGEAAALLGHTADLPKLRQSARNYRRLFDPETGFMRAKNADGTWQAGFDEFAWGGPYTEGGPWQWTWAVPHDPGGLMSLMGGQAPFLRKLDRMLWQPPTFHPGGYGHEIHEMTEMAAIKFGQYAQGNQPVHQVLPLFMAASCPARFQFWSRRALDRLYSPDSFPGDEDNGEMAAWYVFNALGLFPHCPGRPTYVLGSPLFPEAVISLANGKTLRLEAPGNSPENVYANRVTLNGRVHSALYVTHAALTQGGRLEFTMGRRPVPRWIGNGDLPPSLSPYPKMAATSDPVPVVIRVNCGGDAAGPFVGDCFFEGGTASPTTAGEANTPADLSHSERRGTFAYRIPLPMPPAGRSYTVRLHFAGLGDGLQDIRIAHKMRLARFDAGASGHGSPVVKEFTVIVPDGNGDLVIEFAPSSGSPPGAGRVSGIEIVSA